jgi:hypothetical protein
MPLFLERHFLLKPFCRSETGLYRRNSRLHRKNLLPIRSCLYFEPNTPMYLKVHLKERAGESLLFFVDSDSISGLIQLIWIYISSSGVKLKNRHDKVCFF